MGDVYIIILIIWTLFVFLYTRSLNTQRKEIQKSNIEINQNRYKLEEERKQINKYREDALSKIASDKAAFADYQNVKYMEFERLFKESKELKEQFTLGFLKGREWLADAFSEYLKLRDGELECSLIIKPNPALKAAETVSEIKKSRAEMAKRLKFIEYQLKTYEEYFPQLIEYRIAILDELVDFRMERIDDDENIDPALKYGFIKREEYDKLPSHEKFQLALERYWSKSKSNLEIGRVYERYIGYLYESQGWLVKYDGIIKGFEDFGRDLICTKDGNVLIIQCKCWSKEKQIREKYVMQLFGTTILYELEKGIKGAKPLFYSSTNLSEEALFVAERLGVEVYSEDLKKFPLVKCNINPQTKEKIYHLPFDQQYDNLVIGNNKGECYVETVKEAEMLGFRRAYKWTGKN